MQSQSYQPGLSQNPSLLAKLREFQEKPDSLVFVSLAEEYRKHGFAAQAMDIVREGLMFHPDLLGAWIVEAKALRDLKRYAEALDRSAKILQRSPEHIKALQLRADIFLRLGQKVPALKALRQIAYLFPNDRETQRQIIELEQIGIEVAPRVESIPARRSSKGDFGGFAIGSLQDLPKQDADSFVESEEPIEVEFATRTIAELYLRQGLKQKAIEVLKRMCQKNPNDSWARGTLRQLGSNSSFPINSNEVVLDRPSKIAKKAQYLERALARFQISAGSARSN